VGAQRDWQKKAHPSLKSVFFTLKDAQNVPGGKFALKPDELSDKCNEIVDGIIQKAIQD
jgi:hypothetical protein